MKYHPPVYGSNNRLRKFLKAFLIILALLLVIAVVAFFGLKFWLKQYAVKNPDGTFDIRFTNAQSYDTGTSARIR